MLLYSPPLHFLLSGCVGLLVYWLTLTIFSHPLSGGIETPTFLIADSVINLYALLLALSFSVLAHCWEDYTLRKF